MRCRNCNNEVSKNMKVCNACGMPLDNGVNAKCPYCGTEAVKGEQFCRNCGNKVEKYSFEPASPVSAGTSVPTRKGGNKGVVIALGIIVGVLAVILIVVGVLMFQYMRNDKNAENIKNNVQTITKNELTLDIDTYPEQAYYERYTISGSASVTTVDAEVKVNGKIIEKITADSGTVYWSETVTLKRGINTFRVVLADDNGKTETKTVEIKYDPDKESEYLFPSDSVYITESDLYGKNREEIALIRNEIYARHGYIFNTEKYSEYFSAKSWYRPNADFDESLFNEVEKANKDFLVEYENNRGWR